MSERDRLPRWVLWLSLTIASAWLLYTLRGVLAPVFFAFLIAYMLDPLVDRIEQSRLLRERSYGRAVGIAVILAGFFAISVVGVLIIGYISNILRINNVPYHTRLVVQGAIIVAAVLIQQRRAHT